MSVGGFTDANFTLKNKQEELNQSEIFDILEPENDYEVTNKPRRKGSNYSDWCKIDNDHDNDQID